ncbi:MAG: glutathione S-transferase family protein [Cellvibrionaceae bacterium]
MIYKLYYSPGACSLAVHAVLNELGQQVELINASDVNDFDKISPAGVVPILDDNGVIFREGAAIMLHLLERHNSEMLPVDKSKRDLAIQWLMMANATLHPEYGKLFFITKKINDETLKLTMLEQQSKVIEKLWKGIDQQLSKTLYVTGDTLSAADFMIATYANWNNYFPVPIRMGSHVKRLLEDVSSRSSYQKALMNEQVEYKIAA